MSCLRAPWQNSPYKNEHKERHKNSYNIMTQQTFRKTIFLCFSCMHVCCYHVKTEIEGVSLMPSNIAFLNSFNKTGAAIFPMRAVFRENFPFHQNRLYGVGLTASGFDDSLNVHCKLTFSPLWISIGNAHNNKYVLVELSSWLFFQSSIHKVR